MCSSVVSSTWEGVAVRMSTETFFWICMVVLAMGFAFDQWRRS